LIPAYRKLPGFVSFTSGLDSGSTARCVGDGWDNLEHAAGARTALGNIIQQFEAVGVRFDTGQVYELVRQVLG